MADDLGPAIVALKGKLDEQLRALAETKRMINYLLKMSGQQEMYPDEDSERSGVVRADQFYGKGLATSAAEYLAMRRQACTAEDILRALTAGGFDFDLLGWNEDDRLRSLAMSLAKNTGSVGKFHRLKNGTFGLRAWYDPDFLKKAAEASDGALKAKKTRTAKPKARPATGPPPKPKLVKAVKASHGAPKPTNTVKAPERQEETSEGDSS